MKIFSYLNLSNSSNLEADSGYIFQKLLFLSILSKRPDIEIYFLCPFGTPKIDDRVHMVEIMPLDCNKYSVRFDFPWYFFRKELDFLKEVDIAIINQSELTSNFRALFSVVGNKTVKIVTYYHYFPIEDLPRNGKIAYQETLNHNHLGEIIFSRQIEAMSLADYCVTCSQYGKEFFTENIKATGKSINVDKLRNINPPISLKEVTENYTEEKFETKTIVFNHRLYKHYGTSEIFEWLNELYSIRKDFKVIVTDPTGNRSEEQNRLAPDVVELKSKLQCLPFVFFEHIQSHAEYYKILWKSDIGLAPIKPSALWSMSAVDFLACKKPLLAPAMACFPEMLNNHKSLLFNNKNEFFAKLNSLWDNVKLYKSESDYCYQLAQNYTDDKVADKFLELFESS